MLHQTRGVVFGFVKYKETSIIAHILTADFGPQSYIVNGVRTARGKNKIALYQPLTLLDLVVYKNDKKDIQRISEISCAAPFKSIPFNVVKSSMGIFLCEVLRKVSKEGESDAEYFQFVWEAILELDEVNERYGDFHIIFLYHLLQHLGFAPKDIHELYDELLTHGEVKGIPSIDIPTLMRFDKVKEMKGLDQQFLHYQERSLLLDLLLCYYRYHVDHFGTLKSLEVIKEVLH